MLLPSLYCIVNYIRQALFVQSEINICAKYIVFAFHRKIGLQQLFLNHVIFVCVK